MLYEYAGQVFELMHDAIPIIIVASKTKVKNRLFLSIVLKVISDKIQI